MVPCNGGLATDGCHASNASRESLPLRRATVDEPRAMSSSTASRLSVVAVQTSRSAAGTAPVTTAWTKSSTLRTCAAVLLSARAATGQASLLRSSRRHQWPLLDGPIP